MPIEYTITSWRGHKFILGITLFDIKITIPS